MPEVHYPPAFCPNHGLFPATAIALGAGAKQTSIIHCKMTCPKCGQMSEIIPGVYDATDKGLNVLLDASISVAALQEIQRITERLKNGEITPSQAKTAVEKVAPAAAKLFNISDWSDQAKATLYAAMIVAATTILIARTSNQTTPNVTVNVQPVIERTVDSEKRARGPRRTTKSKPPPQKRP